jgi:hypothetical protein
MRELLAQAAALCVEQGLDLDEFMGAAWKAYLQARPGYREFLEDQQLRKELDLIRQAGRMGEA